MKMPRIRKEQMSESFVTTIFLTLSGGFMDAYTYVTRDGVFSNAQTGNVIFLAQHLIKGQFLAALRYLVPILAFALGIFIAERVHYRFRNAKKLHWRQGIVLAEIIILFIVGCLPQEYNMAATVLASMACAMQVQSFRKVNGYGYASTMCIGNLRSGTESLSLYFREHKKEYAVRALHYYGVIFIFAVGAGLGVVISEQYGDWTIWISCVLLFISFLLMQIHEEEEKREEAREKKEKDSSQRT